MPYDTNNVFARILRGEIPSKTLYEDKFVLAFHDISPLKNVHALVIPKGQYRTYTDFIENASDGEIVALQKAIVKVVEILNVRNTGYRIIANVGIDGGQEVPHLHYHIFGGEPLGKVIR